jgi:hypothetical protein
MKRSFFLFIFMPVILWGQVYDDFSDGDFTQNPSWMGDLAHFKVSSSTAVPDEQRPALQLDAPAAGQSCLAVSCAMTGNLEWHFWVKLSLNTSSGNFAKVYLLADQPELKMPLDGYYLQFGGTDDSVDFYRQDSVDAILLARLNLLYTGNSTNALRLRVTRSEEGIWEFFGDPSGTSLLEPVGTVNDDAFGEGNYFGISFQYSSSNTTKFYFDDVYAGPLLVDTISPAIVNASAIEAGEIGLIFNEPVELASSENELNYELVPGIGQPYSAIRLLEPSEIRLFFDQEMQNGQAYQLHVSNISDLAGNLSGTIIEEIIYYQASPYDLIFTEIMADPTPPAGLPEFEYLEIYNRSQVKINLSGWDLVISSTTHELPSLELEAGEYLVFCGEEAVVSLQSLCRVIGLNSFGLANSGTSIQLADPTGRMVCYLEYELSWYNDELKSEGGYSLEMTDPANPCLGAENWRASGHPDGGTPGTVNFNTAIMPGDVEIDAICCVNDRILDIRFSASVDSLSASEITHYSISPEDLIPVSANPLPPDFRIVRINLAQQGVTGIIYHLDIEQGIKNCTGQEVTRELQADFAWPEPCEPFDIIVNEILFNPLGDGVDYVEIYNRSEKAVLLNELSLASVRETPPNPPDTQTYSITDACRSLLPGEYLVLTKDADKVKSQYHVQDPGALLEMASFPIFSNDAGFVMLRWKDGTVIDGLHYREDMHFLMLISTEGVALERICPDQLGDDPGNWHSAAETAGFGTPGHQNSQFLEKWEDGGTFSLHPETFSPDGDGVDDQLGISYAFGEPGKLITVMVFSAEGRLARTLANNEMPGTSGIYSWDGTMDDRTPCADGIYVVYMEALDMDGRISNYKKACVIARRR